MASMGSSRRLESELLDQRRKSVLLAETENFIVHGVDEDDPLLDPSPSHGTDFVVNGVEVEAREDELSQQKTQHIANLDLMDFGRTRRSRFSFVAPNDLPQPQDTRRLFEDGYGSFNELILEEEIEEDDEMENGDDGRAEKYFGLKYQHTHNLKPHPCPAHGPVQAMQQSLTEIVQQMPAIIATLLLILMVAIPFGVAYFPIKWTNDPTVMGAADDGEDDIQGSFPLPGKESLGIRMALFATLMGQLVMTFASNFSNPVAFQLLENVPFYHALAQIVIEEQGYGEDALATLFFLFGLSSMMVGVVFYTLGRFNLGKIAYYFPAHVLVGCIGGIGLFICNTSIEVTNNEDFAFTKEGIESFIGKFHLFGLVILFEGVLRILTAVLVDEQGNQRFRFLAPIYFISIVPVFYLGWFAMGFTMEEAREWGYLFPDPSCSDPDIECGSLTFHDKVFDGHVMDVFKVVDFRLINWTAVSKSFGTLVALCSFSLIHVPINIPAFAVSSNVDVDMNNELIAHGYSNFLSGLFGGLQNVMTYSFSVLFQKSGGGGIPACLAVCAGIVLLFIYGPAIAVLFPRAMAGTLLLHIGLDLFLEGCYDSFGKFDALEYSGIWFITIVMQVFGMTAALLAGILSALSTYAVQSITHLEPIFKISKATSLRSSAWGRPSDAMKILEDSITGRSRVMIFQLQGHLFFGNIADLTDTIKAHLQMVKGTDEQPLIVVLDFTLVVGMDSSASHAICKLKGLMHQLYHIEVSVFVSGSHREGFPCAYALSRALSESDKIEEACDFNDVSTTSPDPSRARRGSVSISIGSKSIQAAKVLRDFPKNRVCASLDEALVFAEDILIARENPSLLHKGPPDMLANMMDTEDISEAQEREIATVYMENIVPMAKSNELKKNVTSFVSKCVRKEFQEGVIIWKEGDESDCVNILIQGTVCATLEGTAVCEIVHKGNIFGELGLVDGTHRLSTVTCRSRVVLYSLPKSVFDEMVRNNKPEARLIERIAIRYLAHRVQHVSNRIFETHCLPI